MVKTCQASACKKCNKLHQTLLQKVSNSSETLIFNSIHSIISFHLILSAMIVLLTKTKIVCFTSAVLFLIRTRNQTP
jgi:hypothetical protein